MRACCRIMEVDSRIQVSIGNATVGRDIGGAVRSDEKVHAPGLPVRSVDRGRGIRICELDLDFAIVNLEYRAAVSKSGANVGGLDHESNRGRGLAGIGDEEDRKSGREPD